MVADYLVDRLRELRKERDARLNVIRSRQDAEKYQARVRHAISRAFAPLPKRTPLNAVTTGVIKRPGYSIEKVRFESRPGCVVTANLYLPEKRPRPLPAILVGCGHALNGKAHVGYQAACQRLVQAGFATLIYDPFSQGERNQPFHNNCVLAHSHLGKRLELVGEFFGTWRLWDSRCALDYLLSRPEVDPTRIGMTGNSGGGTETTWLWPQDNRIKMAAPSCFLTTFRHNLENELPSDAEQYPPGILGAGLELADFFIARAPDPVMLIAQKYDFFDRRGFQEICAEVKKFYRLFNAERNVHTYLGNHPHGNFPDTQQAIVSFFCRQAGLRPPKTARLIQEKDETLHVGLMKQFVPALIATPKPKRLADVLRLPRRTGTPHYRILRPVPGVARYAVETEANIRVILLKVLGKTDQAESLDVEKKVHLCVPHFAAEDEPRPKLRPLYLVDVRGLGESAPEAKADFFNPVGLDYMFHGFHLLLGESYFGRRVHDLLSVIDLLVANGAREIHLHGRGQGALLALFAAQLHPRVKHTTLQNLPHSFAGWAQAKSVAWPAANFPRGILQVTDIPDCLRALGSAVTIIR